MADVKERIKELVDQLEPEVAEEVEQLLSRLTHGDEWTDLQAFSTVAFAGLFDETEVVYTEEDLPESA
jgi:hypothetical protein